MLQVVVLARLRHKDVHEDVNIVHGNPYSIVKADTVDRFLTGGLPDVVADGTGDSLHLLWWVTLADDEILTDSTVDMRQVGNDYSTALLVLYTFYYVLY